MTDTCLGCICEAVSGCNTTFGCSGGVCGLFRITWAYWADSGKPVIQEDIPTNDGGKSKVFIVGATSAEGRFPNYQ